MLRCLDALRAGRPYDLPVYDFTSHARSATEVRRVEAAQVRCVQTAQLMSAAPVCYAALRAQSHVCCIGAIMMVVCSTLHMLS